MVLNNNAEIILIDNNIVHPLIVKLYYQAFDEDGQPYNRESHITITLQDPSKIKMNTWYSRNREIQKNKYNKDSSSHTLKDNNYASSTDNISKSENFEGIANIAETNGKFTSNVSLGLCQSCGK